MTVAIYKNNVDPKANIYKIVEANGGKFYIISVPYVGAPHVFDSEYNTFEDAEKALLNGDKTNYTRII